MQTNIGVGFAVMLLPILATAAKAETFTLNQALSLAYESNPQLDAQRASLRATDEEVAKALAGWRPSVAAQGSYGYEQGEYYAIPGPRAGWRRCGFPPISSVSRR